MKQIFDIASTQGNTTQQEGIIFIVYARGSSKKKQQQKKGGITGVLTSARSGVWASQAGGGPIDNQSGKKEKKHGILHLETPINPHQSHM